MVTLTKEYIGLAREIKTGIEIRNVDGVFSAVWDTGSSCTVISLQLAKKLGFEKVGETIQCTVNGNRTAGVYMCDVILGENLIFNDLEIYDGNFHSCEFLIGMDIINKGNFSINNDGGSTVMKFSK